MNSRADALEEVPEMIEMVAKAIHGQLFALFDADIGSEDAMPDLRAAARAAIEAMRSPPHYVWEAGALFLPTTDPEPLDAHHVFTAMIDAALGCK